MARSSAASRPLVGAGHWLRTSIRSSVYWKSFVLIETVGAGQGDTSVRDFADVLVLLLQPETGDDLQWEKAGLPEVADVVVIHKADLPGADRVEAQVIAALALGTAPAPLVLCV